MDVLQITHAAISMVKFMFLFDYSSVRCSFICIGVCMRVGYVFIFSICLGESHVSYLIIISLTNHNVVPR